MGKAKRKPPQRFRPQQQKHQPLEKSASDESSRIPGECSSELPVAAEVTDEEAEETKSMLERIKGNDDEDEAAAATGEAVKCRHFKRGVNLEKLGSFSLVCPGCNKEKKKPKAVSGKKKKQLRKKNQEVASEGSLWICLACGHVGCEKTSENDAEVHQSLVTGHAVEHSRRQRHPLALHCGDGLSVWCFECGSSVLTQSDLVNGLDGLGPQLKEAVKLVQESYLKNARKGNKIQEEGSADNLDSQKHMNGVVRGLMNLGNTCFFNSVMQNLLALRCLKNYFLSPVPENEGPLTSALRRFFQEITAPPDEQEASKKRFRDCGTYNPKSLFGAVCEKSSRFSGYQEQDSHELLRCLLDGLHLEEEELRKDGQVKDVVISAAQANTFVDHLFGGQFASTVSCCECGYSSSVLEPFLDISLPIPVPEGARKTNVVTSKREVKAKKVLDRRKRVVTKNASLEPVAVKPSSEPVENNNNNNSIVKVEGSTSTSALDDVSWLDYLGGDGDFLDVSMREQVEVIDSTAALTLSVSSAAPASSDVSPGLRDDEQLQVIDPASTTTTEAVCEASVDVIGGEADVCSNQAEPSANEASGSTSAVILLPWWEEQTSQTGWEFHSSDTGWDTPQTSKTGCEAQSSWDTPQPSQTGWESQTSRTAWETQTSQTGWELVSSVTGPGDSDGIGDLFREEEAAPPAGVMLGCANRDEAGGVFEEPEEIIETRIAPMTLEGCLLAFTKLEVLSGDNAWGCDNCSAKLGHTVTEDAAADVSKCAEGGGKMDSGDSNIAETLRFDPLGTDGPLSDGKLADRGKRIRKPLTKSGSCRKETKAAAVRRNATKSLVIKKAPPVLTVHLKRFAQDMRGKLSKLTGHVAFEEVLNLNQFQSAKDTEESYVYRLVGVVEHSGTMRGGHYVAFVRADADDGGKHRSLWYYISDSHVRQATLEQVLSSEAYLLFYERV